MTLQYRQKPPLRGSVTLLAHELLGTTRNLFNEVVLDFTWPLTRIQCHGVQCISKSIQMGYGLRTVFIRQGSLKQQATTCVLYP